VIDPCENIQIDGVWKHIEWIGPTITIYRPGEREALLVEPIEGSRQTQYHIIYPPEAFCVIIHTRRGVGSRTGLRTWSTRRSGFAQAQESPPGARAPGGFSVCGDVAPPHCDSTSFPPRLLHSSRPP
jgi:hypothetical protein